jgi:hypothetical protein
MKNLTIFPLLSHKAKILGFFLTIFSVAFLIFEKLTHFVIDKNLTFQQHNRIFSLLAIVGLFIITFGKEEIDDDRVWQVRAKALQVGFGLTLSVIIALNFTSIIHPDLSSSFNLSLISLIGISSYLIIFNIGLYLDPKWVYTNGSLVSNIKNSRKFYLVYFLIFIVITISALVSL